MVGTKVKNSYKIKTEKKNKIVVEEINPNELKEIWEKLGDIYNNI